MAMRYFPFGNLQDVHNEGAFSAQEAVEVLYQALNALQYLYARGVAHRDLKPENVLVESRSPLSVKLADFGLANDKPDVEIICGTLVYVAPEICRHNRYTTAVDLWSLGVIVLEYVYGLPSTDLQIPRRQYETWGLAWCCRIVDYVNDIDSDNLLDLVTVGMLQMIPEERLSAGVCLTKGQDMGLWTGQSTNSGSATSRPKLSLQSEMGNDDGSTTIILDALWSRKDGSLNRDDESEIGRFPTLQNTSTQGSYTSRAATTPSNRFNHGSKLQGFGTASVLLGNNDSYSRASKRLRSPAKGSTNNHSGRRRVKRRPREDRPAEIFDRSTGGMLSQCLGHIGKPSRYNISYDAVLILLVDLQLGDGKCQEMEIDHHTSLMVRELCEHLARLEITEMTPARNDFSGLAIIATGPDCRETVLASLTPSELMGSVTELVIHLLQRVQLQSSRLPSAPIAHQDQSRLTHDNPSQSWTADTINSGTKISSTEKHGVTYPSALLDCTHVSGCSIPI
ncbi:MAG: hypothetical protein LQ340_005495 [Diploschistes diacapsis]|nr:MAG: hypothetical protein LQ340_005495 [Diploschistes diacapsis]